MVGVPPLSPHPRPTPANNSNEKGDSMTATLRAVHIDQMSRRFYGATETGDGTNDRTWKKLMPDWYGLPPLRGDGWIWGARCPHQIVGKRCPSDGMDCGGRLLSRLWDHARAWRDSDGIKVVTLEPWGNPFTSGAEYEKLLDGLAEHGVRVAFEGRSPYGASYVLFLKRRDATFCGVPVEGTRWGAGQ